MVGSLSTLRFRNNDVIVKEGDPGDLFYIIKDGSVSCTQNGKPLRIINKGSFFGEQALLYNTVRTATVTAVSDVKCVAISRNKLASALGKQLQQIIYQNSKTIAFEKSERLSQISKSQQLKLTERMKVISYSDGKIIIPAGTIKGSKLLIVLLGEVLVKTRVVANVFDCIGDADVFEELKDLYDDDFVAKGETHVAEIEKAEFEEIIGGGFKQIGINTQAISILRGIHILRSLPNDKFHSLIGCLKIQNFGDKDVIIQQNTQGDTFFLINSGKVDIVQDGITLRTVTKHDYFGERSILFNDFRTASVIANGEVSC